MKKCLVNSGEFIPLDAELGQRPGQLELEYHDLLSLFEFLDNGTTTSRISGYHGDVVGDLVKI